MQWSEWQTAAICHSEREGCLANKDIKPVGQYLQAAAASTRHWLHMYFSNVQTRLMPRWRTVGCPHHRRPPCKVSADSFRVHSAARQQPPESLIRHRNAAEGTDKTIPLGTQEPRQDPRVRSGYSPPALVYCSSEWWNHRDIWRWLAGSFVLLLILGVGVYSRVHKIQPAVRQGAQLFFLGGGGVVLEKKEFKCKTEVLSFLFVVVALIQTV